MLINVHKQSPFATFLQKNNATIHQSINQSIYKK